MINFTPEDLVLYLYNETSNKKRAAIEAALEKDWTLSEKLNVLKTSMQRLDRIYVSPRTEAVLKVLKHARNKTKEEV